MILDSGPEMVSIGASGVVWGKVLIRGKQGHAGYPHLAINAIDASLPLLQRVAEYSKIREKIRSRIPAPPGSPHSFVYGRFSLTMLKSGEKENIVPGLCEARFDMRVNPDEDVADAKRKFRRYFSRLVRTQRVRASLEFIQSNSSYFTDPNDPVVKRFLDAVRLTTRKTLLWLASWEATMDITLQEQESLLSVSVHQGPILEFTALMSLSISMMSLIPEKR